MCNDASQLVPTVNNFTKQRVLEIMRGEEKKRQSSEKGGRNSTVSGDKASTLTSGEKKHNSH